MQQSKCLTPLALALCLLPGWAAAQVTVREEAGPDGMLYRVTERTIQKQVPVTEMRQSAQTTYRQQITTQNLTHQQLYCVPVTQYQMVSRLRGRWNPLVTPYWTHEMKPVTTWQQQVATVQIPVTRTAWVPEVQTVQTPVTTYRTAEEVTTTRVALNNAGGGRKLASSGPSATLAARPSVSSARPLGGVAMQNDPPSQGTGTGWRPPSESRY